MTDETLYTIGELAEAAEVTPRTVRYYTAEGLLPPPETRGRYALYSEEHLRRLQLIARLKEAYLPLGEIKARMEQLSAEQVRQLLVEHDRSPAPDSAADYIAQVLTGPSPSHGLAAAPRMLAESGPGYAGAKGRAGSPPAPVEASAASIGFAVPQPPAAAPAAAANLPRPAPAPEPARGLFKRFAAQRGGAAPPAEAALEETWQRLTLAPGVELHVREPLTAELRARVERLIERAMELFDNRSGTP